MKKFKVVAFGLFILYMLVCAICYVSYPLFLRNLVPTENLVYTENLSSYNQDKDIFTVYFTGENIVFRKITHRYITPNHWIKIPIIDCEYHYCMNDPASSTHEEGSTEFNVIDFLDNGSLIAKFYTINDPGEGISPGYSPYFFGFCTNELSLAGVNEFQFKYDTENGYIFAFYREKNPDFNENNYKVSY